MNAATVSVKTPVKGSLKSSPMSSPRSSLKTAGVILRMLRQYQFITTELLAGNWGRIDGVSLVTMMIVLDPSIC